jgi:peptidoglycan hydrolase-like protein with peptidoglycan-binding domain
MGVKVAFVLLGVLTAGLPASAQGLRFSEPGAVTGTPTTAAPRVVQRRALVQPATQTSPTSIFPMAVAPAPTTVVRQPKIKAGAKAAKGKEEAAKADAQKPDASQLDAPKADTQKPDASQLDAPKADTPKADAPKADAPKVDVQRVDAPTSSPVKTDAAKPDSSKPDAPTADVQKIDAAKSDPAKTDTAKADASKPDAAKADLQKADAPKSDPLKADAIKPDVRKSEKQKADAQKASSASGAAAGAMSESDRVAIQSDLALVGDYEGAPGNFDEGTIAAVKAFQQRHHNRATGVLAAPERDALAAAAKGPAAAIGWRLLDDPKTGARLGVPEKLVPHSGVSRSGSRWTSAQGQIQIETFRYSEAALPALFEDEKKTFKRRVSASVLKGASFVISGVQGLKNFIVRAQASGSEVRGVTILYDQATEGIMATVATATAGAFQGFPDAKAALPGMRRAVEYATAIVVSTSGDLLAPGRATEECRSLVVPGLGRAERIAADPDHDLALLRLYGARNLVPAVLSGESKSDTLTLFGVGDPLAQAGDMAVTSVAARRSGQGVEPVPKLGFSGAAAVDAQGRFAGVVNLKAPTAAGGGSVLPQATIIPAESVRGFLAAQGITPEAATAPAADHAAIEKSVMRVICVRR